MLGDILGGALKGAVGGLFGGSKAAESLGNLGLSYLGSQRARKDLDRAMADTREAYGQSLKGMRKAPGYEGYTGDAEEAFKARQALLGFSGAGNQEAAFNRYKESAGYKDAMRSGRQAITGSRAAAGLLGSGTTAKALAKYGQGLSRQYMGQYMDRLGQQMAPGLQMGQNYAGQYNQMLGNRAGNVSRASSALSELRSKYGLQPFGTATDEWGKYHNRNRDPDEESGGGGLFSSAINQLTGGGDDDSGDDGSWMGQIMGSQPYATSLESSGSVPLYANRNPVVSSSGKLDMFSDYWGRL